MDSILLILLIVAAVKFVFFGVILFKVFQRDIEAYREERTEEAVPSLPACVYCQSVYIEAVDEGQTRWENESLVLVTTYECQHCHLPFWHVERVAAGSLNS